MNNTSAVLSSSAVFFFLNICKDTLYKNSVCSNYAYVAEHVTGKMHKPLCIVFLVVHVYF